MAKPNGLGVVVKSFVAVKMFGRVDQDETNAAITIPARRESFSVHYGNLVLLFVLWVMDDLVDSRLLAGLTRFEFVTAIRSHTTILPRFVWISGVTSRLDYDSSGKPALKPDHPYGLQQASSRLAKRAWRRDPCR
jgi:hypothetical protein